MRMVAQVKKVLDDRPDWYGETDEVTIFLPTGEKLVITLDEYGVMTVRETTHRSLRVNMARSSGNVVAIQAKDHINE